MIAAPLSGGRSMRRVSMILSMVMVATIVGHPACALSLPDQNLNFTIVRSGDAIGTHTMGFRQTADGTEVTIQTAIAVKIAFVTVYRFAHSGTEFWHDGRIAALKSTTNDNGTHHQLNVVASGDRLAIDCDGTESSALAGTIPASLWNQAIIEQETVLNTLDGSTMALKVADLGADKIAVHGNTIVAHHYALHGDLERDLWYDEHGTLVQIALTGSDGSPVLYVLR
jgi:hypothetical protein